MIPDLSTWSTPELIEVIAHKDEELAACQAAYNRAHTEYQDFCHTWIMADSADLTPDQQISSDQFRQKTANMNAVHLNLTAHAVLVRSVYAELFARRTD